MGYVASLETSGNTMDSGILHKYLRIRKCKLKWKLGWYGDLGGRGLVKNITKEKCYVYSDSKDYWILPPTGLALPNV